MQKWVFALGLFALAAILSCSSTPSPRATPDPLEYRVTRYFPGLDRTFTMIKSPLSVYLVDDDGVTHSLTTIQNAEEPARRARFGALPPEFAATLSKLQQTVRYPIAVFFEIDGLGDPRLRESDPEVRGQLYRDLRAEVVLKGERLRGSLATMGHRTVLGEGLMPVLWLEATPVETRTIAHLDKVVLILPSQFTAGSGQFTNPAPPNPVSLPGINTTFNANNIYGANQKLAFIESAGCGSFDKHEAFTFTANGQGAGLGKPGIVYQVEPPLCNTPQDCGVCTTGGYGIPLGGVQCEDIGRLAGKQCYNPHLAGTMSVASGSSTTTRYGASDIQFFVPNEGVNGMVACYPQGIDHAYFWLMWQPVHLVNESFHCPPDRLDDKTSTIDGIAQDYYSRIASMTVFRAAGNRTIPPYPCPTSLNAVCVGAMTLQAKWSCYSDEFNLPATLNGTVGDREEPDILAFGGGAPQGMMCPAVDDLHVANAPGGATDWTVASGTSAAAPGAAAMTAMMQQDCAVDFLPPYVLRSWLKLAAFTWNPDGFWRYSTSQPVPTMPGSTDFFDGGGAFDAATLRKFCHGTDTGHQIIDFNPREGSGGDLPNGIAPPVGIERHNSPITIQNRSAPGAVTRVAQLINTGHLRVGDRIRNVISWDACALTAFGTAPAKPAVDIDLFLFNTTTNKFVVASQSVDDNTEGYDHIITPGDGEGDYQTWVASIPGIPCGNAPTEPIGFSWAYWAAP